MEQFDVNLTLTYENESWGEWHIIREFISNALDAVNGQVQALSISEEAGFIHIQDNGCGYNLTYAKRIGASSKKNEEQSIGQFGEGTKMAILTCLRKGINLRLASQNWLIIPKSITVDDLEVLVFDVYESAESISGSLVSIVATPEIKEIIDNKGQYFLQFSTQSPLFGSMTQGIYQSTGQAKLFNKGVYIKDIDTLYSYGLALSNLNRDRNLVDDDTLCSMIRDVWNKVNNPQLMQRYWAESSRTAIGNNAKYKEFNYCIYPDWDLSQLWASAFSAFFGEKAILFTNDLAAKEAQYLGYIPIRLEYCGKTLCELIGIPKDSAVISDDYEFTWSGRLSDQEEARLSFFKQITGLLDLECPETVKIFDSYAKSDKVMGIYNPDKDEIYLKRERLNGNLEDALETFIHELNHKSTRADDSDRQYADGLSKLSAKLILELLKKVGIANTLQLTNKGIRLPDSFSYQADKMTGQITVLGNQILIETNGRLLSTKLSSLNLKPCSSERPVTFHKGSFYINIPQVIRQVLPAEVPFNVTITTEQI
jgi:hypothetical protein